MKEEMTVAEVIAQLQQYPQHWKVVVNLERVMYDDPVHVWYNAVQVGVCDEGEIELIVK